MPLIGTAGHVDHGKSTLIHRITGRDPDRWDEEKRRGLTIDLGFAWATLPDGTEISFVDVPGHERYLKNMLAGIEAIDVALFVVAADEGWMPQSEEHLAVLDLLEVRRGVVALTKADIVDNDLIELASAEVEEKLEGTTLAGSPVIPVSGVTGEGVTELVEALTEQLPEQPQPNGRPRLWIDRVFSLAGAGTIVTGSLLGSPLNVDDAVVVLPEGRAARIRGLHSHEQSRASVTSGRRVAVNLSGIDNDDVTRGHMIGLPGQWEPTTRFSAHLREARFVDEICQRGAYQLHVGSAAHRVEIVGVDDGAAVMQVDTPLPLTAGDRYILRDTGRQLVVGGGTVDDPAPGPTRRALVHVATAPPPTEPDLVADRLLAIRRIEHIGTLEAHSGGGRPGSAILVGETAVSPKVIDELETEAVSLVEKEQVLHPLRPGLSMATLAERLGVDASVTEAVVEHSPRLERRGPDVTISGYDPRPTEAQEAAWSQARDQMSADLAVPDLDDLGLDPELIHYKVRTGELVRINENLAYLPSQIEQIKSMMRELGDEFTVAEFRDTVGLSRKYAVPILEWSDKEGLTLRRGDLRRIR